MKNIAICADLNEESLKVLSGLKSKINLTDTRVHLVHIFEIQVGFVEVAATIYPTVDQYPEIKDSVLKILGNLQKDLGLPDAQVEKVCLFSQSKEQALKEYLEQKNIDLVALSTRGKHGIEGFFASSLADFLCKYSPCDILVMRPLK
jgi:nucleotide-binding universal stress UspA family protein